MKRSKLILLEMVIYFVIYLVFSLIFFLQAKKGSIAGIVIIGLSYAILLGIILKAFIYVKKKENQPEPEIDDLPDDIENDDIENLY